MILFRGEVKTICTLPGNSTAQTSTATQEQAARITISGKIFDSAVVKYY